MVDQLKFVVLDDKTHIIGPGEYTVCGLVIPQGLEYTTDTPDKLCSDCKARAKDTDEFGAGELPAEKKAAAPKEEAPAPKAAPTPEKAKSGSKA